MPSTQVDRNKRYQRKLRKMAEAGTLLYGIFAVHEDDFAAFLSPGEQEMINTIKTKLLSLENAVNMQKILETYLHSKAEWEDPANE
ncbi:MAG TPA: hypothetical protein VKK79_15390, partial [Candidatus Lokiarchaeia archaeon]|nr:hypothetical protein [Candidatus Lokiarchaeia archaeon]